ncbi:MAG: hypothetical protein ACYC0V_02180 [Armatimonadota bacterium]
MKWLKIAGQVVLILIIIYIFILVTLPYRAAREIDARIAAIKAQGDPVSGKDLIPHVPDSENGAVIYEKVFAIIEPGKEEIGKAPGMFNKLRENPELLPLVRKTASKYRSVLPLVEDASSKPHCRFNTNWNYPLEMIVYPYNAKVRNLSRLLSVVAVTDAANGRIGDSMKAVELGYKLSESMKEEPTLIGSLTRIACMNITSLSLQRSAAYGDISESQSRRLFDLLGKIDIQSGFQTAMKGDRVMGLNTIDRMKSRGNRSGIRGWLINVNSCLDKLFYLKSMDKLTGSISEPYRNHIAHADKRRFPKFALMSAIILRVYENTAKAHYQVMATLAGDRVFLAVLAYKSKFGSYPASFDDVESKLGWKLPVDPMTSDRFHYRLEGKGFIVYGLGRNLKDDNAKTVPKDTKNDDFSEQYPYSNGDGRYSADMIWAKSK